MKNTDIILNHYRPYSADSIYEEVVTSAMLRKDLIQLALWLGAAVLFTYFAPYFIKSLFYLTVIAVFWASKKDYFWITFAFILSSFPGSLFWLDQYEKILIIANTVSFSFVELFAIVLLIKAVSSKRKFPNVFSKPFKTYLFYVIILVIYGTILGMGGGKSGLRYGVKTGYMFILITLAYTIPLYINNYKNLVLIGNLLFVVVFFNVFAQFFNISMGLSINEFLGWKPLKEVEIMRPTYGFHICFIGLFLSLVFYLTNETAFKKRYLIIVIFFSFISILITATRGWIISFTFIVGATLLLIANTKQVRSAMLLVLFFTFVIMILYSSSTLFRNQIDLSLTRLQSLESISEGDLTAQGTLSRLTSRHDIVMSKFYESPIFGWGYSQIGYENYDQHVGNQSILLSGGVIGFMVILYFWLFFIAKVVNTRSGLSKRNNWRKILSLCLIIFFGLLIIHSSSTQFFGYLTYTLGYHKYKVFFLALLFSIFNYMILQSRVIAQEEKNK